MTSWLLVLAIIPAVVACLLSIHNFFFSSKEGNYEEINRNRNRNRNKNDSYQRSLFGSTYGSCSSVRVTDTDGDEGLKMLDDSCLSDIENDNDIIYEIIFWLLFSQYFDKGELYYFTKIIIYFLN